MDQAVATGASGAPLLGLGDAVRRQVLPMEDAVDFMCNLYNQELSMGSWGDAYSSIGAKLRGGDVTLNELIQLLGNASQAVGPWRHALSGLIDIVRTGESTVSEILKFLLSVVQGTTMPYRGGLSVRVVGTRAGHPTISTVRLPKVGQNARFFKDMSTTTGGACAAFMFLALETHGTDGGVFPPEDWVDPDAFYKVLGCISISLVFCGHRMCDRSIGSPTSMT